MKKILFFLLIPAFYSAYSQNMEIDLLAGLSNYHGDLQPNSFTLNYAKPAAILSFKYEIKNNLYLRVGAGMGSLEGSDQSNKDELKKRNLSFKTSLFEFNVGAEYRFVRENLGYTPYVFAGAGIFSFKPYTTYHDQKVFLQPLGTEGQGLAQYPQKKPYKLTQFCLPLGIGIKWPLNQSIDLGVEFGHRKLFTDYIDDVSDTYADQQALLNAHGQLAVDLAFRRSEIDPSKPYPNEGVRRGNTNKEDAYYFGGVTIAIKIPHNDLHIGCPRRVW